MKLFSSFLIILLFLTTELLAQEKRTCYTDKDELLMDNQWTLGVFEYIDGSTWFVTQKGICRYKNSNWNL